MVSYGEMMTRRPRIQSPAYSEPGKDYLEELKRRQQAQAGQTQTMLSGTGINQSSPYYSLFSNLSPKMAAGAMLQRTAGQEARTLQEKNLQDALGSVRSRMTGVTEDPMYQLLQSKIKGQIENPNALSDDDIMRILGKQREMAESGYGETKRRTEGTLSQRGMSDSGWGQNVLEGLAQTRNKTVQDAYRDLMTEQALGRNQNFMQALNLGQGLWGQGQGMLNQLTQTLADIYGGIQYVPEDYSALLQAIGLEAAGNFGGTTVNIPGATYGPTGKPWAGQGFPAVDTGPQINPALNQGAGPLSGQMMTDPNTGRQYRYNAQTRQWEPANAGQPTGQTPQGIASTGALGPGNRVLPTDTGIYPASPNLGAGGASSMVDYQTQFPQMVANGDPRAQQMWATLDGGTKLQLYGRVFAQLGYRPAWMTIP